MVLAGGEVRPVCRRNGEHCLPLPGVGLLPEDVIGGDEEETGISLCGLVLTIISFLLVILTLPFSLCVCFKVVQEYERAVIFRLGRLLAGGSKGPGKAATHFYS